MQGATLTSLVITLLLGVTQGCEMVEIPLPEDTPQSRSTKSRSNKGKTNSTSALDLPMMQDSWFHLRPCQDPAGERICRAKDKCVRLESYHYPDHFLRRHYNDDDDNSKEDDFPMLVRLHPFPFHPRHHSTFHAEASFCVQPNSFLNGRRAISLESVRSRGLYLTSWSDGGASHYEDVGEEHPPQGDNHLQLLELESLEYYKGIAYTFECRAAYRRDKLRRNNNNNKAQK